MASEGKSAVFMALIGNAFLTAIKLVAFVVSGSGAMMSETVHSFADTANQGLLFTGVKRSKRPPDERYHYGYGADRFLFALLSAAGIFFLGCGVSVYHGIHALFDPPELSIGPVTFGVLAVSMAVDGYVFLASIGEINAKRGDDGFFHFVRNTTDPTVLAVLFEDFVATTGVLVAVAGIMLSHLTGNPAFDAASSIVIGLMLGVLALWLMWRNRQLVLGPAIPAREEKEIFDFLEQQPAIEAVRSLRSRVVASDRFRIAADVDYDGRYLGRSHAEWARARAESCHTEEDWRKFAAEFGERLMESLGDEVDRIEARLAERFPDLRHVDLEAD